MISLIPLLRALWTFYVILLFLFQTQPSNLLTKRIASLGYFGTYLQVKRKLLILSLATIFIHLSAFYHIPSVPVLVTRLLMLMVFGILCFFFVSVFRAKANLSGPLWGKRGGDEQKPSA